MTIEERLANFELSKLPDTKTARDWEEWNPTARLLIDHPHSYRPWRIVGESSIPGFFHLVSRFRLDPDSYEVAEYRLLLHQDEFTRLH